LLTEFNAVFQIENGPLVRSGRVWPAWPDARAHGAELDMVQSPRAARTAFTNAVTTLVRCQGGVLHHHVCSIELLCPSSS
jgi:hypothetical protein